jgi:hypothetical protein
VEKKNLKWENTVLDYKKKNSHLESIGPVVQKTITEQSNTITVLIAQVASTQKKLELALKSINTAPQEKVGSPVKQTSSKMTVEEEELKAREGYDYGLMKGNEGWITVPEKTREKSVSSKKEERTQKEEIVSAAPAKSLAKEISQPTPYKEAVQRGNQASQMSQAQYVEKMREDIQTVEKPCLSLLQKVSLEKVEEIVTMTLKIRLTTKGQICPLDSMKRIIEETVGIQPLSLSVTFPTSFQILYKKGDSNSFQKLLIPGTIQLVEAKRDNFQLRDINRIAQLYLRVYFKELARAVIQDLPTPTVELVLARAADVVKSRFKIKLMQKKWLFNIKRDRTAFQPTAMEIDRNSS